MSSEKRQKTLVDIDLSIWARVKHFATLKKISVNGALELLLERGLGECGYDVKRGYNLESAGQSLATTNQPIPPERWEFNCDSASHYLY